ncbi:hypothetical protein [Candidatus Enterococcus courvalinii]|uniref:Uncharacterized protein n=1 Tax=Candidatus Enterococcus courvalinii TaxID=2815329 RepID=A0ABS3I2H3_9ENTE|nr:hypothetical protein [Enterococcus sp. MSG2901]MBO0482902.1 hypothetical protein [Enterococcus sp. MSG2901]
MLEELRKIQNEYLLLLKNILGEVKKESLLDSLDVIQMFWIKNRNIILMASDHLFKYHDTFFLTATTIFDVNDSDQNIFLVNSDYLIFDDPIPNYLTFIATKDVPKELFSNYLEKLEEIVIETIQDEIVLLEEKREFFFVLPLRYYKSNIDPDFDPIKVTKKVVQNFFSKTITDEVLTKHQNIEKIINHEAISKIVLFDGDNPNESIINRINNYIERNGDILPKNFSNIQTLYFALIGDFQQAFNVLEASLYFNVIPLFRSFTPYNNYYILAQTLEHNNDSLVEKRRIQKNVNKSFLGYLLYHEYCKRDVDISLSDLKQKAQNINLKRRMRSLEPNEGGLVSLEIYDDEINRIIDELIK